jgi:Ser/Thr protein kinase RdoA (MazF antagonist)
VVAVSLKKKRRSVRALAEYHAAVRSFPSRLRAEGGLSLFTLEQEGPAALEAFTGISGWYLDADGRQRLRSASSYLWRQFVRVPELLHAGGATLPRLVIHGGFGHAAIVLDGGRPGPGGSGVSPETTSPADGLAGFERARYDLRALDLAAALETFARAVHPAGRCGGDPGPGGFDLGRCAELVAAYDEVDRLSPGEVEALPAILRTERLVRLFRLTSRIDLQTPQRVVLDTVKMVDNEAVHLRWLEDHAGALIEALGSALVG